jgi:hypothetical protein
MRLSFNPRIMPLLRFRQPTSVLKPRHSTLSRCNDRAAERNTPENLGMPTKEMPE